MNIKNYITGALNIFNFKPKLIDSNILIPAYEKDDVNALNADGVKVSRDIKKAFTFDFGKKI